ncbi:lin-37 -like protein [Brachionus plicatilis]|uniref:Lin-37-like protein n=1 Tax=Brachionus plicatilis TaxID=10195 RepID=A0A3M7T2Y3_BRAPC|nr:lin-37 -like protein [Brachionus plicatilis]
MFSNFNHNKSPKKKKRKHSVDNCAANANRKNQSSGSGASNTTINIIDRVLDLGKYEKDTGLYTLSRDWINATTMVSDVKFAKKEPIQSDQGQRNDEYFIFRLPGPESQIQTQNIQELNEDIGKTVRMSEKNDLDLIASLNVDENLQTHALLKLHVNRWKQSRSKWLNYYKSSNKAYKDSYQCLKSIFEEFE